jgi:phosphoglycerate dehydrogenase-like enzyme
LSLCFLDPVAHASSLRLLYLFEDRVPQNLRELVVSYLREGPYTVDAQSYSASPESLEAAFAAADLALLAPGRKIPENCLKAAKKLKLLQLWSSGYDKCNVADAARYGIPAANNGGANAISVAEHTLLLMLAVAKWLPNSHMRASEGRWSGNSHGMDMFNLHGKNLGLVGLGKIGRSVAEKAHAFGMKVFYSDPIEADAEFRKRVPVEKRTFEELLALSDVLSFHIHSNEKTRGMLGAAQFARMKKGSVLINVSRAELMVREDLLKALNDGTLSGAAFDVFYEEPTKAQDPIASHPKVVATPHMAGSTLDAYKQGMLNCMKNFERVSRGEKALWVVNGVD